MKIVFEFLICSEIKNTILKLFKNYENQIYKSKEKEFSNIIEILKYKYKIFSKDEIITKEKFKNWKDYYIKKFVRNICNDDNLILNLPDLKWNKIEINTDKSDIYSV